MANNLGYDTPLNLSRIMDTINRSLINQSVFRRMNPQLIDQSENLLIADPCDPQLEILPQSPVGASPKTSFSQPFFSSGPRHTDCGTIQVFVSIICLWMTKNCYNSKFKLCPRTISLREDTYSIWTLSLFVKSREVVVVYSIVCLISY